MASPGLFSPIPLLTLVIASFRAATTNMAGIKTVIIEISGKLAAAAATLFEIPL